MVKLNLITGFLGSGKTTLLGNVLKELSPSKRVAVIQNEFAATGVDGKELKQIAPNLKLVEINNGSVFCVCQLSNFKQTLQTLLTDYNPDVIFLESSGLADPISIAEILQIPELQHLVSLDKIYSMIDAVNFFKGLNILQCFKHQIIIADTIIINKTDLCKSSQIQSIEKEIERLNPFAEIIKTQYATIPWQMLIGHQPSKDRPLNKVPNKQPAGKPKTKVLVLRLHDRIDETSLRNFVKQIQPDCIRIKGLVNLINGESVLIQSVFGQLDIKMVNGYSGQTEIIVFGDNIEFGSLRKLYKHYAQQS